VTDSVINVFGPRSADPTETNIVSLRNKVHGVAWTESRVRKTVASQNVDVAESLVVSDQSETATRLSE
jgi:hypothetical protein